MVHLIPDLQTTNTSMWQYLYREGGNTAKGHIDDSACEKRADEEECGGGG